MPSVKLHPSIHPRQPPENPLPHLLQTPSGLALLELQATIHHETPENDERDSDRHSCPALEIPIGKLLFPDYSPETPTNDTRWMKRVYLYIGRYQRMAGEVQRLARPIAVIRRRSGCASTVELGPGSRLAATTTIDSDETTELEIVDIVRFKVVFANRPEPVMDT